MKYRPLRTVVLLLLALGLAAGCHSAKKADPILRLSAEESFKEGKRLFGVKKYGQARPYFTHAYEVEPNSATGRESLLLASDSLFLEGSDANLLQAEARYRDFQNRFPTSDRAAYVQLQIGRSLAGRMARPDRDQKVTVQAREAFEELLQSYPTSAEAAQALPYLKKVKDSLAGHDFVVGQFYLRFGLPGSAIKRFETVLGQYPEFSRTDETLYQLVLACERVKKKEDADRYWRRLREEFPGSQWTKLLAKKRP